MLHCCRLNQQLLACALEDEPVHRSNSRSSRSRHSIAPSGPLDLLLSPSSSALQVLDGHTVSPFHASGASAGLAPSSPQAAVGVPRADPQACHTHLAQLQRLIGATPDLGKQASWIVHLENLQACLMFNNDDQDVPQLDSDIWLLLDCAICMAIETLAFCRPRVPCAATEMMSGRQQASNQVIGKVLKVARRLMQSLFRQIFATPRNHNVAWEHHMVHLLFLGTFTQAALQGLEMRPLAPDAVQIATVHRFRGYVSHLTTLLVGISQIPWRNPRLAAPEGESPEGESLLMKSDAFRYFLFFYKNESLFFQHPTLESFGKYAAALRDYERKIPMPRNTGHETQGIQSAIPSFEEGSDVDGEQDETTDSNAGSDASVQAHRHALSPNLEDLNITRLPLGQQQAVSSPINSMPAPTPRPEEPLMQMHARHRWRYALGSVPSAINTSVPSTPLPSAAGGYSSTGQGSSAVSPCDQMYASKYASTAAHADSLTYAQPTLRNSELASGWPRPQLCPAHPAYAQTAHLRVRQDQWQDPNPLPAHRMQDPGLQARAALRVPGLEESRVGPAFTNAAQDHLGRPRAMGYNSHVHPASEPASAPWLQQRWVDSTNAQGYWSQRQQQPQYYSHPAYQGAAATRTNYAQVAADSPPRAQPYVQGAVNGNVQRVPGQRLHNYGSQHAQAHQLCLIPQGADGYAPGWLPRPGSGVSDGGHYHGLHRQNAGGYG